MAKRIICLLGAAALMASLLVLPAAAQSGDGTRCSDVAVPTEVEPGVVLPVLPAGTYHRLVVTEGTTCASEGPLTIRGGLFIESGATFVLGSEESPGSTGTISGGVHATNPASVQIHFAAINGGIDIHGGSGPFGGPFDVTWNAIEDNNIHGGATVDGYTGFWFGFIRNHVYGSVNLNNNVLEDTDGNEYVTNVIHGSLHCSGNTPAAQVGDSEGAPNEVTGASTGECAAV
jgi:hypothetical protein